MEGQTASDMTVDDDDDKVELLEGINVRSPFKTVSANQLGPRRGGGKVGGGNCGLTTFSLVDATAHV